MKPPYERFFSFHISLGQLTTPGAAPFLSLGPHEILYAFTISEHTGVPTGKALVFSTPCILILNPPSSPSPQAVFWTAATFLEDTSDGYVEEPRLLSSPPLSMRRDTHFFRKHFFLLLYPSTASASSARWFPLPARRRRPLIS